MKKKLMALLAGTLMMMATSAMAIPIDGTINFSGALNLVGGTSLPTALGIHFINPSLVTTGATGSYASVPGWPPNFTPATFQDFTYAPLTGSVVPLWTLTVGGTTFDFDLSSVTNITSTALYGTGTLHGTGFDATEGSFALTTQAGGGTLSFSATSTVPEPGTMVLLGAGILGLAVYGKRRMNKEA